MLDVDTNPAAIMLNIDDMNILVVGSRSSRCLVIRVILALYIELHFTTENILLRYVVSMLVMHMSIYAVLLFFVYNLLT